MKTMADKKISKDGEVVKKKKKQKKVEKKKYTFSIELNKKNSDFLKTWPTVRALENVADIINLYYLKVYYNINDFMHLSSITKDFVSSIKTTRLKIEHSV